MTVFSPRDDEELDVVKQIVARSYEFATGQTVDGVLRHVAVHKQDNQIYRTDSC